MITFLNAFAEIGGLNALTFLILFFFAFREGYNFCIWIKTEILDKYHNKTKRFENAENEFKELKEMNQKEDKEIEYLKKQVQELKEQYSHCSENQIQYNLAIVRHTLYHIYNRCCKKGYIDQAEYESFESLKTFYLNNGGNSIFKHKIIPYIDSLTVKGVDFESDKIEDEE